MSGRDTRDQQARSSAVESASRCSPQSGVVSRDHDNRPGMRTSVLALKSKSTMSDLSGIGWAERLTIGRMKARPQSAAGRHRLDDDLHHLSDENQHDDDPQEAPKAESRGRSQ